jgi:hypothetical protein
VVWHDVYQVIDVQKVFGLLKQQEHLEILKEYPYDDLAGLRVAYCAELRKKGFSDFR